jgi:hypothetical protein
MIIKMTELKSFIDETFNNLKSKIEEEHNSKIQEHFTKISIDVSNDSYSNEEYGKIDIGKIKHPEGRYIIHQIEFDRGNNKGFFEHHQIYRMSTELWKHIDKIISSGTMLIDNFGERYVFFKTPRLNFQPAPHWGGQCSPNIKGNPPPPHIMTPIKNIIDFEYQLIPSINEYEYPLTNKIIDFVKSQNWPIDNLNILSNIMASIEIFKKTYGDQNKELKELNEQNQIILSKLEEENKTLLSQIQDLQSKLDEQLKVNEMLSKRLYELI